MQENEEVFLSIIVPVFNVEQYIADCLESIIASQLDCEVIMIEDGSDDNSLEICKRYKDKYETFHLLINTGKGLSDARNMGLEKATGDYIWFVDSDDLICDDIAERIKLEISKHSPDVIAFDAVAFNETVLNWNLNYYDRKDKIKDLCVMSGKDFFKRYYLTDAYRDSACLNIYKKDFLDKNTIRFVSGMLCEDISFTFEVYMLAETMIYVPQNFYKRRYRNNSITTTISANNNDKKIFSFYKALQLNINLIKKLAADEKLRYVFRHYLFDYYSVQIDRIEQFYTNDYDKNQNLIAVFDLFFQECTELARNGMDLSGVNMILTYMSKIEKLAACQIPQNRIYKFENSLYSWNELRLKMQSLHKVLIIEVMRSLPFDREINVGIYGIGKHTERLLKEYRENIGEVKANLIFFDSNAQSHTMLYEGKDVLNINEIFNNDLKTVIISSCRYQDEMYSIISRIGSGLSIIKFYTESEDTFDYFL